MGGSNLIIRQTGRGSQTKATTIKYSKALTPVSMPHACKMKCKIRLKRLMAVKVM